MCLLLEVFKYAQYANLFWNITRLQPLEHILYITYNLVSMPTPWAVAGPHGQLASLNMPKQWFAFQSEVLVITFTVCIDYQDAFAEWEWNSILILL